MPTTRCILYKKVLLNTYTWSHCITPDSVVVLLTQPRPPPTIYAGNTYLTFNLDLHIILMPSGSAARQGQQQSPGAHNSGRRLQMRCSGNLVLHPPMRIYHQIFFCMICNRPRRRRRQVPRSSRLVTREHATNTRGRAYVVRRVAVSSPCFAAAAPTAPSPSLRPLVSS